jgi:hypothetical protein
MRAGPDVETTYDPVSRSIEPTRPPLCQCRARVRCRRRPWSSVPTLISRPSKVALGPIRADHHGKNVIEAKRRRHVEPVIVLKPNADGMND